MQKTGRRESRKAPPGPFSNLGLQRATQLVSIAKRLLSVLTVSGGGKKFLRQNLVEIDTPDHSKVQGSDGERNGESSFVEGHLESLNRSTSRFQIIGLLLEIDPKPKLEVDGTRPKLGKKEFYRLTLF